MDSSALIECTQCLFIVGIWMPVVFVCLCENFNKYIVFISQLHKFMYVCSIMLKRIDMIVFKAYTLMKCLETLNMWQVFVCYQQQSDSRGYPIEAVCRNQIVNLRITWLRITNLHHSGALMGHNDCWNSSYVCVIPV